MKIEIVQFERIKQAEVPDFLFEKIKNKIENEERNSNFQSKLLLAAAIIVLFVNIGIVGQQKIQNHTPSELDYLPYSTLNHSLYE